MIASKVLRKEGKKVLSDLNSHSKHKSKKSEREAIYDELVILFCYLRIKLKKLLKKKENN